MNRNVDSNLFPGDDSEPLSTDPDHRAIVARRNVLVALALTGFTGVAACGGRLSNEDPATAGAGGLAALVPSEGDTAVHAGGHHTGSSSTGGNAIGGGSVATGGNSTGGALAAGGSGVGGRATGGDATNMLGGAAGFSVFGAAGLADLLGTGGASPGCGCQGGGCGCT